MHHQALFKAIRQLGSQAALAKKIGVSQRIISHWLNRETRIPFQYAIKIYLACEGKIPLDGFAPQEKKINKIIEVALALSVKIDQIEG